MSTTTGRSGQLVRAAVAALLIAASTTLSLATTSMLPTATAVPPAVPTDSQGYLDSPARCGPGQNAVMVGRTALSLVAICAVGGGRYEYRGIRLSDGAVLTLPAKVMADGCFGARTEAVDYTVSERKLLLTSGLRVMRDETMVQFRDYRVPPAATTGATGAAVPVAPATQQAANRLFR
ncbi:MAG: hypothetical protein M3O32_12610 [Actinomycetota bacterium]|nr:hypothetical protein [Actinomycetota bacterium]